jgi:plasmid maintenance system killer protein
MKDFTVQEQNQKIFRFLNKRGLIKLYVKVKTKLESGDTQSTRFKLKKPKHRGIYSFRINKQYRAIGVFRENIFVVYAIDDHQT